MIEAIIFFALGFLVSSLLGLVFLPLVHARAVRLTRRRMEAITPVSITEIQADKDHLRAEFAVATRQLELTLEQLKTKATTQMAEVGRKLETIARLQTELEEKSARITELEASEKALQTQLLSGSEELMQRVNLTGDLEKKTAAQEAELAKLRPELAEANSSRDSMRVELVAMQTQLETTRDRLRQLETQFADKEQTISERGGAVDAAAHALADMKRERDALQSEVEAARVRQRQTEGVNVAAGAAATRHGAEKDWERERAENAELRERIAEVAAEVARLTIELEGADSPIPAMLAAEHKPAAHTNGSAEAPTLAPASAEPTVVSLAERIRALQSKSSRVEPATQTDVA